MLVQDHQVGVHPFERAFALRYVTCLGELCFGSFEFCPEPFLFSCVGFSGLSESCSYFFAVQILCRAEACLQSKFPLF
jgi:hypothetical protein